MTGPGSASRENPPCIAYTNARYARLETSSGSCKRRQHRNADEARVEGCGCPAGRFDPMISAKGLQI